MRAGPAARIRPGKRGCDLVEEGRHCCCFRGVGMAAAEWALRRQEGGPRMRYIPRSDPNPQPAGMVS